MTRKNRRWLIIHALSIFTTSLFGARPFTIDDAGIVAQAGYELEVGFDYWRKDGALGIGFKHGLTEKMDLGIGFGYTALAEIESETRFSGAEMCFKYNFVPDFFSVSMATAFQENAYVLNSIVTRYLGNLEVDGNLGYCVADNTLTYGCALIYSVMGNLNVGIEASGDKDELSTWLVGANYSIFETFRIDGGFMSDFDLETKTVMMGFHSEF